MNRQLLFTALFLSQAMACSAVPETSSNQDESSAAPVASKSESITVSYCANASSKGCWEARGNDTQIDFSYFNVFAGGKVFVSANDGYKKAQFVNGGPPLGYVTYPNGLPTPILSITTFSNGTSGTAQMLGENGKIYLSSGAIPPPSANGVDWATITSKTPKLADNTTLCLFEIEVVRVPAPALSGSTIGLGCDLKLYYKKGDIWESLNLHPGYQSLPTNVTYKHVSRMGAEMGATFVTSQNDIWMAGKGSYDARTNSTTWQQAVKLPAIRKDSRTTLKPYRVGGRYVITEVGNGTCTAGGACDGDDDRIYWYDEAAGVWKRFTAGLPWYPQTVSELGICTNSTSGCDPAKPAPTGCGACYRYYPYYENIRQVGGAGASDFAVWNLFSWVYRWRKA